MTSFTLFDDPEFGKRRVTDSFDILLSALVDFAWVWSVKFVFKLRLGTGGGGGLLVGR